MIRRLRESLRPAARQLIAWVDNQVPNGRRRRQKELQIYRQLVTPGDLCFDVGANVGNTTGTFLRLGARVVCIEPQEGCMRVLERRFRSRREVTLVRQALADRPGEGDLWICRHNDAIATMAESWITAVKNSGRMTRFEWADRQAVPVTTLDVLIQQHGRPALCKIDVEGFELQVLRGLSQPIPYVSFEFHREWIDDAMRGAHHLETLGQAEFNFSTHSASWFCLDDWSTAGEVFSRIAAEADPVLWGDVYVRFV